MASGESSLLVVGGGIAGLTVATEAAEAGRVVYLVEREAYLGGRVARLNRYFPKLCPPYCGLEIQFQRLRRSPRVHIFTLSEVEQVGGKPGAYEVTLGLRPRYVDPDRCTACGECAAACPVERSNPFNYGMDHTKAAYLPHELAMPMTYAIDGDACRGPECGRCVTACRYGAIDLQQQPRTVRLRVGAIAVATGWRPYDAARLSHLGFGAYPDVITNVMMERLAAPNGPTRGRILRPSDGRPARSVAFVQCAGSRDINHLPYCSGICCLASMKQALYVTEQYPEGHAHVFHIDIRAPGTFERFFARAAATPGIRFVKGKVAAVGRQPATGDMVVEAEDEFNGRKERVAVDLVVLAVGMVPQAPHPPIPGLRLDFDPDGFASAVPGSAIHPTGVARAPADVATTVRDATGTALKLIQVAAGG